MYIAYVNKKLGAKRLAIVDAANAIIQEYEDAGYSLTLRQLYYQFVSRGLLPNNMRSYKMLGDVVNDARLAGLISWKAIEDRTRNLQKNAHWDSPAQILRAARNGFYMDKWEGQQNRVEVWIEKDALLGVIKAPCVELDVPYFSCRGYVSQSEMWAASQRLLVHEERGHNTFILHLGDHDPSGVDMTRDIEERLRMFGAETTVRRIALTMAQVRELNPPPNPAKLTDTRSDGYIRRYGDESWELDALEPAYLDALVRQHVLALRDDNALAAVIEVEMGHREYLAEIVSKAARRK